jgi:hypothetical protein
MQFGCWGCAELRNKPKTKTSCGLPQGDESVSQVEIQGYLVGSTAPSQITEKPLMVEILLLTLAASHIVAGVSLTLLPFVPAVHLQLITVIFGAEKVSEEIKFLIAVFGPTVASWGVLFYALVKTYFRSPTRGTWWALVISIVVWAPMDSALCLSYGLYPAVALNAAVASLFLGLLLSARHA